MQQIPLPTGLRGESKSPEQSELLANVMVHTDAVKTIVPRCGVRQVEEGIGSCRGSGLFKEELYQVSNDRLIKITLDPSYVFLTNTDLTAGDLVITDLGEIVGNADCELVAGFTKLLIMVKGGAAYVYDDSAGLVEITDASYKVSVSACYIQGKYVFVPQDGGPFFWSELFNPAVINSQSYADAEEFPDPNKVCWSLNQQLYIGGTRSFERLQFDSNRDTFIRIAGASRNVGYAGGVASFGESFAFIGRGANGGFAVYDIRDVQNPISNAFINELLNTEYSLEEMEGVNAEYFRWQSQDVVVFYLPRHTIVYYGDWAYWYSGILGDDIGTLNFSFMQFAYGYTFTGDVTNRNIGVLTENPEDYGERVEGKIETFIRTPPRTNMMVNHIYLNTTTGQDNGEVLLSISGNGVTYGSEIAASLGVAGDRNREVSWGSPIGKVDSFMGLRFRWYGDIS